MVNDGNICQLIVGLKFELGPQFASQVGICHKDFTRALGFMIDISKQLMGFMTQLLYLGATSRNVMGIKSEFVGNHL